MGTTLGQRLREALQDVNLQNILRGLRNMVKELLGFFMKLWDIITKKEKPIEIPEAWKNPNLSTEIMSNPTSVAVEPSIVFEQPQEGIQQLLALRMPWMLGVKRVLAFVLLITCCVSMYWTARSFPFGLLLTGPSVFIFLDYLLKTQPTEQRAKWYMLRDIEGEEK